VAPIELTPIEIDDIVKLRKPHACGGYEWTIVRLGADIGLKCNTCGRRVLLPRREFERRLAMKQPKPNNTTPDTSIDTNKDKAVTHG
jgi:hypothetical protein